MALSEVQVTRLKMFLFRCPWVLPLDAIFLFAGIQSTSVIYNQMEAIAWGKGIAPSMQKLPNASPLGSYLNTAMIIILLL